ncbi:DUF3592 domain-containing protein [Streptomyces lunaelactis]|uniref:DUF3592 domain-containing protein n=1 Tax=Streptomyces lunaelactis TaxID=1535768 RepID=UPI00158472E9|nr:DUF3592 domain-containing protein [Streptomyces lunaelactis]NUK24092.1 DUF3592 domain-containing protein [Streptomyces lunaelactis]
MSPFWLLTLVPFLAGVAICAVQGTNYILAELVRSTGRSALGTVTGHIATREASYSTAHPVVRWTTDEGTEVEHPLIDNSGAPHRLPEGSQVRVLYTPGNPQHAQLDSPAARSNALFALALGTALWLGSLVAVLVRIGSSL